jgi:N-methylhydantoinase A
MSSNHLRIAVDIGGTFTDLAAYDERTERLLFGKALTTHDAMVEGIGACAQLAGVEFHDAYLFLHGSTIAINTLLERTGARTALLITEGFRDIYEIGRVNRPDAYNLFFAKHEPLTSRSLRFEVPERLRADGSIHHPLDERRVQAIAEGLRERGVEAVAIILLHSYRDPRHEARVREIVQSVLPDAFITASHTLSQEYREFERASTVAANAYIGPRVTGYLGELDRHFRAQGFDGDLFVMQSTGGLCPVEVARSECIRILESGPAAGIIGARALCERMGMSDAIAFDMGGTTAKAGVILEGRPLTAGSALVGSYEKALPIQVPTIDIFEVGTGGGSIASVGAGGALRVGPQSAGSMPGPACYDLGGRDPTVTDANLVLGRLDAARFLGGQMHLNEPAALQAIRERVALPLGLDPVIAAEGILRIAVTTMSLAVKGVTTARGLDAGRFAMVVYGGAGPLHASAIARELGISTVIIPFSPGHFSACGMLFSDLRYDYVRSIFKRLNESIRDELEAHYQTMEADGRRAIERSTFSNRRVDIARAADMRYVGQEHAVTVDLPDHLFTSSDWDAVRRAFDSEHLRRYGTCAPNEPVELVSVRLTARSLMKAPPLAALPRGKADPEPFALRAQKPVYFASHGFVNTPVYDRTRLLADNRLHGPALIEEHASTTVLEPGDELLVHELGALILQVGGRSQ